MKRKKKWILSLIALILIVLTVWTLWGNTALEVRKGWTEMPLRS